MAIVVQMIVGGLKICINGNNKIISGYNIKRYLLLKMLNDRIVYIKGSS